MEAESAPCEQPDAGVEGLDDGIGEVTLEGDHDRFDVVDDCQSEFLEGLDLRVQGPLDPLDQEIEGLLEGELEDEAQVLLEEMGPRNNGWFTSSIQARRCSC